MIGALLISGCVGSPTADAPTPASTAIPGGESSTAGMAAHLEARVLAQESAKDVRCWSSVQKLEMYLAGVEIAEQATYAKIEGLKALIESVWRDANAAARGDVIDSGTLAKVLDRRFPRSVDAVGDVTFAVDGPGGDITITPAQTTDFDDTVEHLRLLQAWVEDHDTQGRPFSDAALDAFADFLVVYHLAVLTHAGRIAKERHVADVDAAAMTSALALETRLRGG